jgi:FixJ family two-component response regulator
LDDLLVADHDAESCRLVELPDRRKVIAVVDDDAPVCRALERLLRSAGYAVETFAGGAEFLLSLQSRLPDCLLLDLRMPRMNGMAVLARLATSAPTVPTVVISGSAENEGESRATHAGAAAVLRKPVDDRALLSAVAAAMSRIGRRHPKDGLVHAPPHPARDAVRVVSEVERRGGG